MAKSKERIMARRLRKRGKSIKQIAKVLEVSVSSVSLWTRDVVLTKKQYKRLEENARNPFYGDRLRYINKVKRETDRKDRRLRKEGSKEVGEISKRELFLVGVGLYWSEGFKKDSQVGFANSDPDMINLFLRWLYECFGYKPENLIPRVTLNLSHEHRTKEIEKYWAEKTNIPLRLFRKPFYQRLTWKKIYENKNSYFGVLRIKVRKSRDFLRKVNGFIEGLRVQSRMV